MAVASISPHLSQIQCPDVLRGLQGWLIWRYEQRPGEAKPRKVPSYVAGGRRGAHGTAEDRAKLTTFDAAVAAAARKGFDGVGLAMLPEFGVVALDFDHAATGGVVNAEVEALCLGTYAEFSPSGEGVRAFVMGTCPNKKSFDGPYGFETFCSSGFVTFTGNRLLSTDLCGAENTIAPLSPEIRGLIGRRLLAGREPGERPVQSGTRVGLSDQQLAEMLKAIDPDDAGYEQWLQVGMALHHETDGEGFDIWDEWSSAGPSYPGRDDCQRKWDSFGRQDGPGVTVRSLMKLAKAEGVSIGGPVAGADDFEDLGPDVEAEKAAEKRRARFEVVPASEYVRRPPPGWVVRDVLPKAELVMLYGESTAGKSFIATDLGMAIARGIDWRGHKVKQGRVVYLVAEGGGGYRNRIKAYAMFHEVDLASVPFGIINAQPNFLRMDDIKAVREAIAAAQGADVIFIDTFAQVTAGANENAGEDMGLALRHARMISEATGAVVVIIHHSGKDVTRGARGWSGLKAAADAELEVSRSPSGTRVMRTTKQKDGKEGVEWGFDLRDVLVDLDDEGEPIGSCVVVEAAVPERGKGANGAAKEMKLGPWEKAVLETYAELALGGDVSRPELVLQAAEKRQEGGSAKVRRASVLRAIKNLSRGEKAVLGVEGDLIFEVQ